MLGGVLGGQHCSSWKRKRAMFLGPHGHIEIGQRQQGVAEEGGAAVEDLEVPDLSFIGARDAMRTRLDSGKPAPDALFAGSDTMALGALAALREHGVAVPTTCHVFGYDDSPLALHHPPALTTVRQDPPISVTLLVDTLQPSWSDPPAPPTLLPHT